MPVLSQAFSTGLEARPDERMRRPLALLIRLFAGCARAGKSAATENIERERVMISRQKPTIIGALFPCQSANSP